MENLKWMKKVLLRPQDTKDYYNFKLNIIMYVDSMIMLNIASIMHFSQLMEIDNISFRKDCIGLTTASAVNVVKFVYAMVIIGFLASVFMDAMLLAIAYHFTTAKKGLWNIIYHMFVSIAIRVGSICCFPVLLSCSFYESTKICCASLLLQLSVFFLILYDFSIKVLAKENK